MARQDAPPDGNHETQPDDSGHQGEAEEPGMNPYA